MKFIYVEEELLDHPRTIALTEKLAATVITVKRYGEVFNRHGSHFRLQKKQSALILAAKHGKFLYEIPSSYGIGAKRNFYFSHLLNCPYDCRYCFLQGMYRSAHYVLFVNYEDFAEAIKQEIGAEKTTFFSGYDGDSLALEAYSGFLDYFLPFFAEHPSAELELRTKSTGIQKLLNRDPIPNVVIAYTLTPEAIARAYEPKTPPLKERLKAIKKLQEHGWQIGLRFDPMLYIEDYKTHYSSLFEETLALVKDPHSITLGTFRLPMSTFKEMERVKPREELLAICKPNDKMMVLAKEEEMLDFATKLLPKEKLFICREKS